MISTNQFKNGLAIEIDGVTYIIEEFQHVKPGKGGAFVRIKLRNLRTGNILERNLRAGEKFQEIFIEEKKLQYQYRSGDEYHFMDLGSYEDTSIPASVLGKQAGFLKEQMEVSVQYHGSDIIGVTLPIFVELTISEVEPGLRGDTSKAGTKPARLETGVVINVPLFVERGERIRVDTRSGEYIGRAQA
ncbi:MAG: elongation factor P [Candidatus Omnitrophica bacterium]|nr:elongation factor P [Candidatus Omnitrophota bacterium]